MISASQARYSTTFSAASAMTLSASRRAAVVSATASRRLASTAESASAIFAFATDVASRVASRTISAASASAVEIYLRPRDSAPARILRALFSAPSRVSFAVRLVSLINRSAAAVALASRACADLIIAIAVSVARISNSSRLKPVISRRALRSANCDSSSRMRSTGFAIGARSDSSRKPTQLRKFFSAIVKLSIKC